MGSIDIVIPAKDPHADFPAAVNLWLMQRLPEGWCIHLFLVNDGSTDFSFETLAHAHPNRVTVLTHSRSRGRAAACNAGVCVGGGDYVAIFDADCFPAHVDVLANFIGVLETGADIVYGHLTSQGSDFWGRYFRAVCARRERRFINGDLYSLTTACFLVRRKLFQRAGGFDENFRHYGFEDRDLIIRLMGLRPSVSFSPLSKVVHGDDLCLEDICRKHLESGRYTSWLFREKHPDYYASMHLALFDSRQQSVLNLGCWLIPVALPSLLRIGRVIVGSPYFPYSVKVVVVKLLSGGFYFVGTRQSWIEEGR